MATGGVNDDFLTFVSQWNNQVTGLNTPYQDDGNKRPSDLTALHDPNTLKRSSSADDLNLSSDLDNNDESAFEWALNLNKRTSLTCDISAPGDLHALDDLHTPDALHALGKQTAPRDRNILSIADEIAAIENKNDPLDLGEIEQGQEGNLQQKPYQESLQGDVNHDLANKGNSESAIANIDLNNNSEGVEQKSSSYVDKFKVFFKRLYRRGNDSEYSQLSNVEANDAEFTIISGDVNKLSDPPSDPCDPDLVQDPASSNPVVPSDLCVPSNLTVPGNLAAPDILCGLSDDEFNRLMQGYDQQLSELSDPSSRPALMRGHSTGSENIPEGQGPPEYKSNPLSGVSTGRSVSTPTDAVQLHEVQLHELPPGFNPGVLNDIGYTSTPNDPSLSALNDPPGAVGGFDPNDLPLYVPPGYDPDKAELNRSGSSSTISSIVLVSADDELSSSNSLADSEKNADKPKRQKRTRMKKETGKVNAGTLTDVSYLSGSRQVEGFCEYLKTRRHNRYPFGSKRGKTAEEPQYVEMNEITGLTSLNTAVQKITTKTVAQNKTEEYDSKEDLGAHLENGESDALIIDTENEGEITKASRKGPKQFARKVQSKISGWFKDLFCEDDYFDFTYVW